MSRRLVDIDVEEVKAAARELAADLGYSLLKPLQEEVVVSLQQATIYSQYFQLLPCLLRQVNCIPPEQTRVLKCYQTLPLYAKGRQRQTSHWYYCSCTASGWGAEII